jgi:YVTN family beta-propeller protein
MFTSTLRSCCFSLTATLLWLFISGAITITHAQARAYVAESCNNTVDVIDTRTNTVIVKIPVGAFPHFLAVTPDATRVYVSNRQSNSVSVIDTATNTVISTIPIHFPSGIAISPDSSRVYVTTSDSSIAVIDTSTNTVIDNIPDSFAPYQLALTRDGTRLYVTHGVISFNNTVSVIDVASHQKIATIPVRAPAGIVLTPDNTRAYVAGREGGVFVIDTATNTVINFVAADVSLDVALTPNGARGYLTNVFAFNVQVFDTTSNTIADDIPFDGFLSFLAVTSDGRRVYVTENLNTSPPVGAVAVIETATNTIVDEITGLQCVNGIAIAPPQFPRSKDNCKEGGYQRFGPSEFRNQGQCLKYVKEHAVPNGP